MTLDNMILSLLALNCATFVLACYCLIQWRSVDMHWKKTLENWRETIDAHRKDIMKLSSYQNIIREIAVNGYLKSGKNCSDMAKKAILDIENIK